MSVFRRVRPYAGGRAVQCPEKWSSNLLSLLRSKS
eukprot:SAG11_NODE_20052_length_453_cov_1.751412_1_plen_34_part_10